VKTTKFNRLGFSIALCALAANAFATSPILVSNTNDAGEGSLRVAITKANEAGGGEIEFCVTGTITLSSPLASLTNITISGPGTNLLTVSGSNRFQVFSMHCGTTNALSGLTIADGMMINYDNYMAYVCGAGISNSGCLKLLRCAIRGCAVIEGEVLYGGYPVSGGGIYNSGDLLMIDCEVADCVSHGLWQPCPGGGIANDGDLRMEDCTISGCVAYNGAGTWNTANAYLTNCIITSCSAREMHPQADGGGILSEGTLTMHSCIVSNCEGFFGGGIDAWGGKCAITNSIIVDNSATLYGGGLFLEGTNVLVACSVSGNGGGNGGGIYNYGGYQTANLRMFSCTVSANYDRNNGGGIYNDSADLGMVNCTVSGNGGGPGGGIFMDGGSLTLISSTICSNTGWGCGGIWNDSYGTVSSENCIFAGNVDTMGTGNDFYGLLTSEGYTLIQNTSGSTIVGDETGNIYGAEPLLGPLQDNGGPTWTHALLPGSPAIDAGNSGDTLAFDQRGIHRPQGLAPDIGAFEFQYATPMLVRMAVESCTNCCLILCGLSGGSYTLQTSTNLVNWFNVATNIADVNGVCQFTERGEGKCSRRFYRPLALGN